jgi:hypothetical protein
MRVPCGEGMLARYVDGLYATLHDLAPRLTEDVYANSLVRSIELPARAAANHVLDRDAAWPIRVRWMERYCGRAAGVEES